MLHNDEEKRRELSIENICPLRTSTQESLVVRLEKYINQLESVSDLNIMKQVSRDLKILNSYFKEHSAQPIRINNHILVPRCEENNEPKTQETTTTIYEMLNLNKVIGKGVSATLFQSDGVIKYTPSDHQPLSFKCKKENKKHIIKVEPNHDTYYDVMRDENESCEALEESITYEYMLNKISGNSLHCKPPVFFRHKEDHLVSFSFLTMRFKEGKTLLEIIEMDRVHPFSFEDKLEMSIGMLTALQSLHRQGVAHNDLHTHNIIINLKKKGTAHLIDLGSGSSKNEAMFFKYDLEGDCKYIIYDIFILFSPQISSEDLKMRPKKIKNLFKDDYHNMTKEDDIIRALQHSYKNRDSVEPLLTYFNSIKLKMTEEAHNTMNIKCLMK